LCLGLAVLVVYERKLWVSAFPGKTSVALNNVDSVIRLDRNAKLAIIQGANVKDMNLMSRAYSSTSIREASIRP
jgi:hypothetical protein